MENNTVNKPIRKVFECNKVKFATEKDAQFSLSKIKATSDRKVIPVRVYLCKKCSSWHLTSKRDIFEDEKIIAALNKEIVSLKGKIIELEFDIKGKADTIGFLNKRNGKEENVNVKSDSRVKELITHNSNLKKEISKQREDNKKLINELVSKRKVNVESLTIEELISLKVASDGRLFTLLLNRKSDGKPN